MNVLSRERLSRIMSLMSHRFVSCSIFVVAMLSLLPDHAVTAGPKPPPVEKPGIARFDPPPLDEIDAKAGWIDMPVLDSLFLLREKQKGEASLATVAEALSLANDSDEA